MKLLAAEVKRLAWRRLTWLSVLLVGLVTVGMALSTSSTTSLVSDVQGPVPVLAPLDLDTYLYVGAVLACFGAGLMGATFIGAEMASGSLSQWLTFSPDRNRVYAAKLAAVAAASAALGATAMTLMTGVAWSTALTAGRDVTFAGHDPVGVALRGVVLVVLAGITGFSLASLFGHTAAAPVGVAAWLAGSLMTSLFGSRSWLAVVMAPEFLIVAFLQGSYGRHLTDVPYGEQLVMQWPVAGAIMGGVVAVVVAAAWFRFAKRDVA